MAHLTTRSSAWRARDRRTASGTRGRHALLNSKSGRRAGKDADRGRLDRADEPDAQRASRVRYLRVRHQPDEQTQEGESVRQANRTPQQLRTRACQILPPPRLLAPFDLQGGFLLRHDLTARPPQVA